eukprot:SAG31_NODE_34408_length_333_cov_0.876068_1_plen_58_part_01
MPPDEKQAFDAFYSDCNEVEQQATAVLDGATPAMMFHVVVIDQEAEQQQAMASGAPAP